MNSTTSSQPASSQPTSSQTTGLPVDHLARAAALDPTRSLAVAAPAGSGKTGLLTQRVLTLLPLCQHPEELLAITFTRKAAAEMQERIVKAIVQAATQERPSNPHDQLTWDLARKVVEHDQQQQWHLLSNPNRLRIQTIDGLCRSLSQHNPISSGMGGSSQLLEHPSLAYRSAVESALKALEQAGQLQHDLDELLQHLDNDVERVCGFLVSLLARRDQWLVPLLSARNARDYLEAVLTELVQETLQQTADLIGTHASDLCLLADYAASNLTDTQPDSPLCQLQGLCGLPEAVTQALPDWQLLAQFLLTADGNWRKAGGLNVKVGFPSPKAKAEKEAAKARKQEMAQLLGHLSDVPGLLETLRQVRLLPPCRYPQQQWRLLDGLTRIMPHVVGHLKLTFRNLNATDFTEITQAALTALGSAETPSDLALLLDYQIKHILVDEFQDTSSPQLQLLELLTAGWQTGDGRSLFIVGDGMQSCYGFRDANVGIFLDARRAGIGDLPLEPLDLQVNFRSQQKVVQWVNEAFTAAFPSADDIAHGAVRYSPSQAFNPPRQGEAVYTHLFVNADDRSAEAQQVCTLVQQALNDDPTGTVAILVRNRPHLKAILPALKAAGIQAQATDIDPLASRMAVVDALSLTNALLNPSDRNAWLALLRSPLIGLDNGDLLALAGLTADEERRPLLVSLENTLALGSDSPSKSHLSQVGRDLLQRALPTLQLAWRERRRKRLRLWIEGVWTALGGPATLLNPSDHVNLQDFFTLLDKHDNGGRIDDRQLFELAVRNLYAKPAHNADARVQVMTIHKSKGLEFDTVIMPGLDRTPRTSDKELILWQQRINHQHQKQLLLSPLAATGSDDDPLYHYLREEQKLKESLEATRLLYVGCTRAIKTLHLLANVQTKPSKSSGDGSDDTHEDPQAALQSAPLKAPSSSSLLNSLWQQVEANALRYDCNKESATNSQEPEQQPWLPLIRRLAPDWQRPALVPSSLLIRYRGREFDDETNQVDQEAFNNRVARHIGTVLHRALAQIVAETLQTWNDARILRQIPFWQAQLRSLGLYGHDLQTALSKVELGVRKTLAHTQGQWLLNHEHHQSACELALWSGNPTPRLRIIDRTFVDNDQRWIVDYKSSEPNAGQTLDAFLQQEAEHYRPQLQGYQALFTNEATDLTCALYFPLLSVLHPVAL